jgi:type IV pilus assembly protein PilB
MGHPTAITIRTPAPGEISTTNPGKNGSILSMDEIEEILRNAYAKQDAVIQLEFGQTVPPTAFNEHQEQSLIPYYLEWVCDTFKLEQETVFGAMAHATRKSITELVNVGMPEIKQPVNPLLPVRLLSMTEYGIATLVTPIPFIDDFLDQKILRKIYGGIRIRFTYAVANDFERYCQRLEKNDKISQEPIPDQEEKARNYLTELRVIEKSDGTTPWDELILRLKKNKPKSEAPDVIQAHNVLCYDHAFLPLEPNPSPERTMGICPNTVQRKFNVCPVSYVGNVLTMASYRYLTTQIRSEISANLTTQNSISINYVFAKKDTIDRIITTNESNSVLLGDIASRIQVTDDQRDTSEQLEDITAATLKANEEGSVVDLVNGMLLYGSQIGATDMHISDQTDRMWVRYRVDGQLTDYPTKFPKSLSKQIISRIKIMASLDTQFTEGAQDGQFQTRIVGVPYECRVCTTNTVQGEKAVIRFQRKSASIPTLIGLGFKEEERRKIETVIDADHGCLVICGPTGAGKTTTLYAILGMIDRNRYSVCTAEQPVEMTIENTDQSNIRRDSKIGFGRYVEAVLRQDPDYILIGETRDTETATMAMRAAITGHTVFTTLHTNSASGAPNRLIDLGVEPYLANDALTAVCAQRLIPKLCTHCRQEIPVPDDKYLVGTLHIPRQAVTAANIKTVWQQKGCKQCRNTGIAGRIGIMEAYMVDSEIRHIISDEKAEPNLIRQRQMEQGGKTLFQHACDLAFSGVTSLEIAASVRSVNE